MTGRPRVVSLVPSATETLIALGANVIACTRFCNQPELPTVGGTKNPDVPAILSLRPDLVVVDTEENRRDAHVSELADAFPTADVVRVDGEDVFWWGIRTPVAQTRLSRVVANEHRGLRNYGD